MSENRFWFVIDKGKLEYVQDNVAKEKITVSELEDLLNEQQSIIDEQKIAIDEMITDYKNLEKENEQLRKKLEQIYSFKGLNCRCVNGV